MPTWEANPRSDKLAAAAVRVPTTSLAAHPLRRVAAARRPARSVWRSAILWARLLGTNALKGLRDGKKRENGDQAADMATSPPRGHKSSSRLSMVHIQELASCAPRWPPSVQPAARF